MEDDRRARGGEFQTGYPQAEQPPLVTTDVLVHDTGNCSPQYIRATMYCAPNTQELLKSTELPFSLHITPMADRKTEQVLRLDGAIELVELTSLRSLRWLSSIWVRLGRCAASAARHTCAHLCNSRTVVAVSDARSAQPAPVV